MSNKIDPYADFGPSSTGGKTSAGSSSPTSNLSKPHLALVVVGAIIALVCGVVQLNQGTGSDLSGLAKWGPWCGVALGFLIVVLAGRKVKRFQG